MQFNIWKQQQLLDLERLLEQEVAKNAPQILREPMRYATLAGGKRLRALLLLATAQAFSVSNQQMLRAAAAVELIHAYSLVHDDLPCMDNDELRRGKPSVHVKFGENMALLAGDALQAEAFNLLTSLNDDSYLELQAKQCKILANAAGAGGMAGGQAIDLSSIDMQMEEQQLQQMHKLKTGALIHASVMLGLVGSKQLNSKLLAAVSDLGWKLGLAFQVVDDVLDETVATADLGKTAGKDKAAGKPTYVSTLGLAKAQQYIEELHQQSILLLGEIAKYADVKYLQNLVDSVILRTN